MPTYIVETYQTRDVKVFYEVEAEDHSDAEDKVMSGMVDEVDSLTKHVETTYFSITRVEVA